MTATDGGSPTADHATGGRPLGSAYVVYEAIGRGATGEVWRGVDRRTAAPVAVKILRPGLADDPRVVERFLRERSILAELDAPNVVGLRDLVVEGDTVALVTDLVTGGDLRARLRRDGTLTPALAVDVACQILEGLDAAHTRGVVHRDLKPENVLLSEADAGDSRDAPVVRITDFGIATLAYSSSTVTTSIVGSPEYLAPEVIERGAITPAVDVYSAGIVLYEMLAGRTPFAGGPPIAVVRRQVDEPPPRIEGVPVWLWSELASLLAKDPSARPGPARVAARRLAELADELDGLPAITPGLAEPGVVDLTAAEAASDADARGATGNGGPAHTHGHVDLGASEADTRRVHLPRVVDEVVHQAPPGAAPTHARPSGRGWQRAAPAVAAAVVLAGIAGVWAARRRDEAHASTVTFVAAPVIETTGAVVTRTLELTGAKGDRMKVVLRVRNPGEHAIDTVYEPVLTPGAAAPATSDRITPYHVRLGAHDTATLRYSARLPAGDLDTARLAQLEARLDESGVTNALAVVHAGPDVVHLRPQQRAYLDLSGVVAHTSTDELHVLLSSIVWNSSDRNVADVEDSNGGGAPGTWRPVITASRVGHATLHADVGVESLDVDVVVSGARVAAPSTPCEPGVGDPPGLTALPDATSVASPDDGHVFVIAGGARLPVVDGAAYGFAGFDAHPQQISDADLAAISTVPRDGTLLAAKDRAGRESVVLGGAAVPVTAADVEALGLARPVTVLQAWVDTLPAYDPATFAPRDGTLLTDFARTGTVVRLDDAWRATADVCPAAPVARLPRSAALPAAAQ